ncbi:MAG TPA: DUF4129 domain-containing protein [Thermoleophilaceae bacterium]
MLAAAALLPSAAVPAPAAATEVTRTELSDLAERARTDIAALHELRRVDRVDGKPYAIEDALAGARDERLDERLEEIAALSGGGAGEERSAPLGGARGDAQDILSDNRYEGSDVPRPFKGVLDKIGDFLEPIGEWIENAFDDLASGLPGGDVTLWSLTAALILIALLTLGSRTLRARAQEGAEARAAAAGPDERDTPGRLERAADEAERAGDLETALRLRFRAGLLRLDARDAIRFRPSISTREVSHALNSPEFDRLAALFDGVAYGGEPASRDDLAASREGWDAVLKGAAR